MASWASSAMITWMLAIGGAPAPSTSVPPPRVPRVAKDNSTLGGLKLERSTDGGFVHKDVEAGFVATIGPDGSVRFRDYKGPRQPHLNMVGFNMLKGGRAEPPQKPVRDDIVPHGPYGPPPILLKAGVRLPGLSHILSRSKNPHSSAKRAFIEQTEPLRTRLAISWQRKQMRKSLGLLGTELVTIWRDRSHSFVTRRRLLFERWDDCEDGSIVPRPSIKPTAPIPVTEIRRARLELASEARRRIERFIRRNAPKGTGKGYSPDELRRLNAERRSRVRFDPYAKAPKR